MKLSKQEIRVKVAELCGWTFITSDGVGIPPRLLPFDAREIPNYPEDLNACAEMEATLKASEYERYRLDLWNIVTNNERPVHNECAPTRFERAYLSALPTDRCLAFLRTHSIQAEVAE